MESDALISPCGQYRYWLTRKWDDTRFTLPIIMLNPSTADASVDDPTIRRCIAFARQRGFGGIRVMNLFSFRSPSPAAMKAAIDPVGPGNDGFLNDMLRAVAEIGIPVLAAWGTHGSFRRRDMMLGSFAKLAGAQLVCLGTTKDGHPKHPLYVKGDQPFVPFAAPSTPQGADNGR